MKLATVIIDGKHIPVVRGSDTRPRLLTTICQSAGVDLPGSVMDFVRSGTEYVVLQPYVDVIEPIAGQFDWAPPILNPSKILGVAFNNKELMKKAYRDPGVPNYFLKPPSAMQAHGKPIIVDPEWGAVIPEPEICAVIGKRAKHISEAEALDHVFGYTIHNDVTSHGLKFQKDSIAVTYDRDMARPEFYTWRKRNGPDDTDAFYVYHTRSKGTDTFGPLGPWITTSDEVSNPNDLHVRAWLNDDVFTEDHTGNYRFTIEACIAEASRYFTLEPGDLISFGTTGRGTPKYPRGHKSVLLGEVSGLLAIEIDTLGRLENPIVHKSGGA
jgi:2-keto-4-pentenoate hydratase/2-oxohepta-3-ene-1,7-dioic acid hydratase in catechol pathway